MDRGSAPGGDLLRLLAWAGLLAAVILLLGRVPAPLSVVESVAAPMVGSGSWSQLWTALNAQDPLLVVFTAGRAVLLLLAWYQLGLVLLGCLARLVRLGRLLATVELLTLPPLRRLLWGAVGLSMSVGGLPAPAGALPAPPATLSAAPAPPGVLGPEALPHGSTSARPAAPGGRRSRAAPAVLLPPGADGSPVVSRRRPRALRPPRAQNPAGSSATDAERQRPDAPSGREHSWTVQPGDHLWAIAEATVRQIRPAAGREEVASYWLRLVERNRPRLPDPANPDLILPGMQVRLPPIEAGPS